MPTDTEALADKLRRLGNANDQRTQAIRQMHQLSHEIAAVVSEALGAPGIATVSSMNEETATWQIDARGDTLVVFTISAAGDFLRITQNIALTCSCAAPKGGVHRTDGLFYSILGMQSTASALLYWKNAEDERASWSAFDPESNKYVFESDKLKSEVLGIINRQLDSLIAERSPK